MFISFDNLHELREFLSFIGLSKREPLMVDNWTDWTGFLPSGGDAQKTEVKPEPEAKTEVADKPKRTRRTKAEVVAPVEQPEQPEQAEAEVVEQVAEVEAAAEQVDSPAPTYFEDICSYENTNRTKLTADAPDGRTATLAGIAVTQETPEEADVDAEAFINARADELIASEKVSKPVEHMARCTQFIGAHSRAVYDQSFELAGLPKTIATFKAPQIARHQAALEFLSKSN